MKRIRGKLLPGHILRLRMVNERERKPTHCEPKQLHTRHATSRALIQNAMRD